MIISVSSLGDPGVISSFEWMGTLQALEPDAHLIFLRDRGKTWFNDEDGWLELIDYLKSYQEREGVQSTYALGLSMGGYGAAILAAALPIRSVLMLAPQACINEEASFDHRFNYLWSQIEEKPRPSLIRPMDEATSYLCCFTVDDAFDVKHASLLMQNLSEVTVIPIRGQHNVGGELRARDEHRSLIGAFLGHNGEHCVAMFSGDLDTIFLLAALFIQENFCGIQRACDQAVMDGTEHLIPAFCYPQLSNSLMHRIACQQPSYTATAAAHAMPAHAGVTAVGAGLRPYLGRGWAKEEYYGFWSIETLVFVRAYMTDIAAEGPFEIMIAGEIFAPRNHPQSIIIRDDDRRLHEQIICGDGNTRFEAKFSIPGPLAAFTIETPNAVSPKEVTASEDPRTLGVWLKLISFMPPRSARIRLHDQ